MTTPPEPTPAGAVDRERLLALYDVPDPAQPGRRVPGYDRDHAARTTAIALRVGQRLGISQDQLRRLEVLALLHDLGRAGMDPALFGRIFGAAQRAGLPVRVRELQQRHPGVSKDQAADFFLELARPVLVSQGLSPDDPRVQDHVAMRMAYDRRLKRVLQETAGALKALSVTVDPWMEGAMLYYYYPERMEEAPEAQRLLAMILVAAENLEAYNNRERARDYYTYGEPRLREAFRVLQRFVAQGLVSPQVYGALRGLVLQGALDDVLKEAQGRPPGTPWSADDQAFLEELQREHQTGGSF